MKLELKTLSLSLSLPQLKFRVRFYKLKTQGGLETYLGIQLWLSKNIHNKNYHLTKRYKIIT